MASVRWPAPGALPAEERTIFSTAATIPTARGAATARGRHGLDTTSSRRDGGQDIEGAAARTDRRRIASGRARGRGRSGKCFVLCAPTARRGRRAVTSGALDELLADPGRTYNRGRSLYLVASAVPAPFRPLRMRGCRAQTTSRPFTRESFERLEKSGWRFASRTPGDAAARPGRRGRRARRIRRDVIDHPSRAFRGQAQDPGLHPVRRDIGSV